MPTDAGTAPRTDDQVQDKPAQPLGWSNVFVHPDYDPRSGGGFKDERAMLAGLPRERIDGRVASSR